MINSFANLKKINSPLTLIIFILNFIILGSIFSHTILFCFGEKNIFLSNLIVIFSLITFSLKLLYWYSIKKFSKSETINEINKSKLFLLRLTFSTFIYLAPAYYIFNQKSLVMNDDIILITLIIISIIAFIGIFIERHLFFIESKNTVNLHYKNKLI
jgi:DMSO reductase anchor subunit